MGTIFFADVMLFRDPQRCRKKAMLHEILFKISSNSPKKDFGSGREKIITSKGCENEQYR